MNSDLLFDFSVNRENKTVQILREFNARIDLVWDAWTTPELLDLWWGPKPMVAKTKVMNFEVDGRRFFAMISPDGQERWFLQKFTSISPKTNFKTYNTFADKDENPELPGSDWDLSFSEKNGTTKVNITITNESRERFERIADGFREGFTLGLQQLDELLLTLSQKQ
ncbi:SRPBCC family protein [Mucilaginibacter flavidus]|uniref:SRPBCC family protein n=1 Tax=Mucilaginibacter flavidus TaxID=2949309 RepID=UPI0020924ED6|nr:SRPBCC domain-containing protein [Mucilaginibacter flavidus]MCO5946665.1 SRPBCC domain-containing protein [Mucilaginibacter flavidus]